MKTKRSNNNINSTSDLVLQLHQQSLLQFQNGFHHDAHLNNKQLRSRRCNEAKCPEQVDLINNTTAPLQTFEASPSKAVQQSNPGENNSMLMRSPTNTQRQRCCNLYEINSQQCCYNRQQLIQHNYLQQIILHQKQQQLLQALEKQHMNKHEHLFNTSPPYSCKQNDCSSFHSISTSSHPFSNSSNEDRCCSYKSSSDGSTCESAKLNCYAGAKFGDAPEPVMLPLPPKHWLKCRSSNSSSLKPCDDLSLQLKVILQVA